MFGKIVLAIIVVVALLWGYGFYKGYSDVSNGANFLSYYYVCSEMNPVSRSGYKTYFHHFTDMDKRIGNLFNFGK